MVGWLGDDLNPVFECHTEHEFWQLVADPTEKLVSAIDEFVRNHDAKLAVALQHGDERLISYLRKEDIPFVTLDGAPAYAVEYGSHFTPEGNQFVSRVLEKFLTEQVVIN